MIRNNSPGHNFIVNFHNAVWITGPSAENDNNAIANYEKTIQFVCFFISVIVVVIIINIVVVVFTSSLITVMSADYLTYVSVNYFASLLINGVYK